MTQHASFKRVEDILVVDANRPSALGIREFLLEFGYDAMVVEKGSVAMALLQSHKFDMILVDLELPDMSGLNLIEQFKHIYPDSIVLVVTNLNDPDTVIQTMKLGVFDYIIKPVQRTALEAAFKKALEIYYLKIQQAARESQVRTRLRGQLEWLSYKEARRHLGQDGTRKVAINNLKTVLSQGIGIGASVTLIDMIESVMQPVGDNAYKIGKDVFDLLLENNKSTRNLLDGLKMIEDITMEKPDLKVYPLNELWDLCKKEWAPLFEFAESRNIKILIPEKIDACPVMADAHEICLALEELLLNACKYSVIGSEVQVHIGIGTERVKITILNRPEKDPGEKKIQNLFLESFYRDNPPVEGAGSVEKFGMGLGLAVVNQIMYNHQGSLEIQSVADHTSNDISLGILSEIQFPLHKAE